MIEQRLNKPSSISQNNNNFPPTQTYISETTTKVDLSKVDATEETMSQYTYPKEFLKLDLDKIREFIDILEEHYQNLVEQEDMIQAKSAKQRLILLKNLEKEKMKKEATIIYSNQRELVQDKMKEELDNYINNASKEFDSLLQAFESQEVEMLKGQKQEMDELKKNFVEAYETKKPKPSKEILNWIKIRNYALKQNKFDKVEEANKEINKLQKKDDQKFEKEKEKKLRAEINKLNHRHENEKNALQMKKNSLIDMFNQTKNKNIEQIQKKFDAKMKELKNYQSFEMANFDKITKGITKPCARIQSIVSSTTGIKEDENDENGNENEANNEMNNKDNKENEQKENEEEEKGNEEQIENGEEENNNINDGNENEGEANADNNNELEGEEQPLEQEEKNVEEEANDENEEIEENNNINRDNEE
jgi:hypothetical protein